MLSLGNNNANSRYFTGCNETGVKPHPARFPPQLPAFFIRFLTNPGDVVLDPFAGSCTTGAVAENLGRRWIAIDREKDYLEDARFRFESPWDEERRACVIGNGIDNGDSTAPGQAEQVALPFK